SGLLCKHVHAVQFVEVARDQRRLGIVPGPTADAVTSIHGLGGSLGAQIGVPCARACPNTGSEGLAWGVGTSEPAEVTAVAQTRAGDEETHALWRVLRLSRAESNR